MNFRRLHSLFFASINDLAFLFLIFVIFGIGIFRHVDLPGIYMDGVNPDYLVAQVLNPELKNPTWLLPFKGVPLLGGLYHGLQNAYIGLPIFWLLGTTVTSLRIAQSIFGFLILASVFFLVRRITQNRHLSLLVAIGLATDVAFLASFRTQNYIVLGGFAWLILSICLLINFSWGKLRNRQLFFSGFFAGLSVYGYFVQSFFLPVFLVYFLLKEERGTRTGTILMWGLGVFIGLTPYIIGYVSMGFALGGVHEFLDYLKVLTSSLAPLSSNLSWPGSIDHELTMTSFALSNGGNELLIFDQKVTSYFWSELKFAAFIFMFLGAGVFLYSRRKNENVHAFWASLFLISLPLSYILVGSVFGNRLQSHHFSVLIPIYYLILAVFLHQALLVLQGFGCMKNIFVPKISKKIFFSLILTLLLLINLTQQQNFFSALKISGGTGRTTDALNLLAYEALNKPKDSLYIFPEWGFFMPFAFLTGNSIPYRIELRKDEVQLFHLKYKHANLFFWNEGDIAKYRSDLKNLGVEDVRLQTYYRRDGLPAFFSLTADF